MFTFDSEARVRKTIVLRFGRMHRKLIVYSRTGTKQYKIFVMPEYSYFLINYILHIVLRHLFYIIAQ